MKIILCILLIYFIYQIITTPKEDFNNLVFNIPTRHLCPTRNMSYDLRCEPKIPVTEQAFLNSGFIPHPDCDQIPRKCLE